MLGGAAAGRAAHVQPHPARVARGGGGRVVGPGGAGVALGQQDPHAVHTVAVAALEEKEMSRVGYRSHEI